MKLGKVIGKVWATHKDPQLKGIRLYALQPVDEHHKPMGSAIIAADAIGSSEGDIVFWVSAREATFALPGKRIPSDASIVGILDSSYTAPRKEIDERKRQFSKKAE
jgi:ethanolamine utilization protein EutN